MTSTSLDERIRNRIDRMRAKIQDATKRAKEVIRAFALLFSDVATSLFAIIGELLLAVLIVTKSLFSLVLVFLPLLLLVPLGFEVGGVLGWIILVSCIAITVGLIILLIVIAVSKDDSTSEAKPNTMLPSRTLATVTVVAYLLLIFAYLALPHFKLPQSKLLRPIYSVYLGAIQTASKSNVTRHLDLQPRVALHTYLYAVNDSRLNVHSSAVAKLAVEFGHYTTVIADSIVGDTALTIVAPGEIIVEALHGAGSIDLELVVRSNDPITMGRQDRP